MIFNTSKLHIVMRKISSGLLAFHHVFNYAIILLYEQVLGHSSRRRGLGHLELQNLFFPSAASFLGVHPLFWDYENDPIFEQLHSEIQSKSGPRLATLTFEYDLPPD